MYCKITFFFPFAQKARQESVLLTHFYCDYAKVKQTSRLIMPYNCVIVYLCKKNNFIPKNDMLMNLCSYKISGRKMLSCLLASFCISAVAQESSIGNPSGAIQKSSRAKAKVAYVNEDANAVEYTLSGYSIFKYDEETESYENVYMYGGRSQDVPRICKHQQE